MANIAKKAVIDAVESRIKQFQEDGSIHFPANYSPQNALKSAWLVIQDTQDMNHKKALDVCTQESVANALLNTVVQGLSPAKKQVYYIVYGSKLEAQRSYFGTMAVTKRLNGVKDVFAQVIYEGDEFEFVIERGRKRITKHTQKLENIDITKIIGAYATILYGDGEEFTEVMNKAQIDKAFAKSKMKTNSVQKDFTEEMSKRTVINRTCKMFVNTSDDSDLVIEAFHATEHYDQEEMVDKDVEKNANQGEVIDITDTVTEVEQKPEEKPSVEPEVVINADEGPGF